MSLQTLYGQCGGSAWTGATACVTGAVCSTMNPYYAQCISGAAATSAATVASAAAVTTAAVSTNVVIITTSTNAASETESECEAEEPTSTGTTSEPEETDCPAETDEATTGVAATATTSSDPEETDCPAEPEETTTTVATAAAGSTTLKTSTKAATTAAQNTGTATKAATSGSSATQVATSKTAASSVKASGTTTSSASTSTSSSQTKFAGINIAGFDFGCTTDGTCVLSSVSGPITSTANGSAQMEHFVKDDNMNIFRLPVGWQFLVADTLGGDLDATNFGSYNTLMQSCLSLGVHCVIDIHNYARWNGTIIGQGGPTNDQFVSLWKQLATEYANETNVIFGIMNEPHDLTVSTWAETVQAVVTAIRDAGATTQYITMPGSDYTSAGSFISDGSAAALLNVTNPDGTSDNLIFEVHKYLDSDNSGTNAECTTDNIDTAFSPLATWLRTNKRMALLGETGGGNVASCETYLCKQIAYLNANSDVYLGYLGWAAGSFATSYVLSETPTGSTDQSLVKACLAR